MNAKVTDIKWDTDGDKRVASELPKSLIIKVEDDLPESEIEDFLSDEISDQVGFCHFGFKWSKITD